MRYVCNKSALWMLAHCAHTHMCVCGCVSLYVNIYKFVERSIAVTSVSAINLRAIHTHFVLCCSSICLSFLHLLTHSFYCLWQTLHTERDCICFWVQTELFCSSHISFQWNGVDSCIHLMAVSVWWRVCVCVCDARAHEYAFRNIKRHHSHIWLNFFFHFIFEL